MPLINMLVMCGNKPPAVISICNCTDHMVEGGKKDTEFIMNLKKKKVDESDPSKVYSNSFFFDGAANVQKAGQILCAHFPQAMCFYGGKHVLSLFFSDLSRLGAFKVSFCFFNFFYLQHTHFLLATCLESMQTLQYFSQRCQSCNSCSVHGPSKHH